MAKKQQNTEMKVKKKKWVTLVAPFFNDQVIGETNVADTQNAIGKQVKSSLMYLAGDPKKQNININFMVSKARNDTTAIADVLSYRIQLPSLKKMVRRGKTKVQDSFKCRTSDGKAIQVKSFIITRNVVNNNITTKIRRLTREFITREASKKTFDDLLKNIIDTRLQRELKAKCSKIYPLRAFELYSFGLTTDAGKFETPTEEKVEPVEEEETEEEESA